MTSPSPTIGRLAQQARQLVSSPSEATLEIDGERQRHTGACSVGLAEHGGIPAFFCSPNSALAASAELGRPAVLVLRSDDGAAPTFARLVGVLVRAGYEDVDGVEVVRVNLDPARVSLHAHEHDGAGTEVPLEAYLAAEFTHPTSTSSPGRSSSTPTARTAQTCARPSLAPSASRVTTSSLRR